MSLSTLIRDQQIKAKATDIKVASSSTVQLFRGQTPNNPTPTAPSKVLGSQVEASPTINSKSTSPAESMAAGTPTTLQFPHDNKNLKYFMRLEYFKYKRPGQTAEAQKINQFTLALPLPREINDQLTVVNREENTFGLGAIFQQAANEITVGAVDGQTKTVGDVAKTFGNGISTFAGYAAKKVLSDTVIGDLAFQAYGAIPNPHPAVFFEGVNLRRFTFYWRALTPTSSDEAAMLAQIIKQMKAAALPGVQTNGTDANMLTYPLMVKPSFVGVNGVDINFKFGFIESVTVNYTPHGFPTFFNDGKPHSVDITLNFHEIELLTAADFDSNVNQAAYESVDSINKNVITRFIPGFSNADATN